MNAVLIIVLALLAIVFALEMRHSLRRSSVAFALVQEYEHDLGNPELVEKIYAFIESDWKLRRVMRRQHGTKADIRPLIKRLLLWGNLRKGRRFIPITSFFYVTSLEYLLKHKDGDPKKLAMKMMNFFHF